MDDQVTADALQSRRHSCGKLGTVVEPVVGQRGPVSTRLQFGLNRGLLSQHVLRRSRPEAKTELLVQ